MIDKLRFILLGIIFTNTILLSCKSQEKKDIPMEQRVIHTPKEKEHGFFSEKEPQADKIVVSFHKTMITKKATSKKNISSQNTIAELMQLLLNLPKKGDIYKKLSPQSSFYHVQFYSVGKLVGDAKIYNNSLQMANTAFLKEANEHETVFIEKVKEIIKKP